MNSRDSSNLLIEPPSAPTPPPEVNEDAGSQALSEALRSSFAIVKALMIGLVIVFFASGFFTINQQERGIILRFGKPVGAGEKALLGPGAQDEVAEPHGVTVEQHVVGGVALVDEAEQFERIAPHPEGQSVGGRDGAPGRVQPVAGVDGVAAVVEGRHHFQHARQKRLRTCRIRPRKTGSGC